MKSSKRELPHVDLGHDFRTVVSGARLLELFGEQVKNFGPSGFRKVTWTEQLDPLVTHRRIPPAVGSEDSGAKVRQPNTIRRGFSPGVRVLGGTALYPLINNLEFQIYQSLTRLGVPSTNVFRHMSEQRQRVAHVWTPFMDGYHGHWALLRERDIWLYAVGEALWYNAWGLLARRGHPTDILRLPVSLVGTIQAESRTLAQGLRSDLQQLRAVVTDRHPMLSWNPVWNALEQWLAVTPEEASSWDDMASYSSGTAFEMFVAQLLRKLGYLDVQVVGGPYDKGVDISCRDPQTGELWGIQVKWRTTTAVSSAAVEEVVNGCRARGGWKPWLVMSQPRATEAVRNLCAQLGVRLWTSEDMRQAAETAGWTPRDLMTLGR